MGSRATSMRARIGGLEGRALRAGDRLAVIGDGEASGPVAARPRVEGPIRFVWGLHAEVFSAELREKFVTSAFRISSMMDRMGVRLRDEKAVFIEARILSLVSDPVVVGDIQILAMERRSCWGETISRRAAIRGSGRSFRPTSTGFSSFVPTQSLCSRRWEQIMPRLCCGAELHDQHRSQRRSRRRHGHG